MDADLDTLATALYVRIDDLLKCCPERAPWRPVIGICPQISDAELVTLAVMQALLGFVSEARWLRYARKSLRGLFPYLPGQSGYNKRPADRHWRDAPMVRIRNAAGPCSRTQKETSALCTRPPDANQPKMRRPGISPDRPKPVQPDASFAHSPTKPRSN
jgi:hypothetical protein